MPTGRHDGPPGAGALAALPFAGVLLGGVAGVAGSVAARVAPAPLPGAVAFATLAALTGGIHLDGFLDGCDAFFASVDAERRLAILADPHHGTFAVVGMFAAGSLAIASLGAIPPRRLPQTLAFAAGLARAASVAGAFVFPGAGGRGGATHYERSLPVLGTCAASFGALACAALAADPPVAIAVPLALGGALACERWIVGRLGGLAGDAYGFTIVVIEVALLVALAGRGATAGRDGDCE